MIYAAIFALIVIIFAKKIYLIAPSRARFRCDKWKGQLFAHRGLWSDSAAENGLKAFEKACEAGYGIELDVQFTSDKRLVVFHDDDAKRMCGVEKTIKDMTLTELKALRISENGETIPTFDEVLDLVAGRAPLLVEVKSAPDIKALTKAAANRLKSYDGRYIMESFNPLALYWLRKNEPRIIRGQLVCRAADYGAGHRLRSLFLASLSLNFLARPDFIAYSHDMRESMGIRLQRALFKTPMAVWTLRDARTAKALSDAGEMPIFEEVEIK